MAAVAGWTRDAEGLKRRGDTVVQYGPPDDGEDLGALCNKTDDAGVADFIARFDAEIVEESPPDRP